MQILLIEDEEVIRRALSRHLQRDGHQVVAVSDLAAARQALAEQAFEGVVSDLKLPDGSSLELLEASPLPAVLMSGFAVFEDAVRAMRLGCVDFLTKPVPKEVLLRAVARLQDRPRRAPDILAPRCAGSVVELTAVDAHSGQQRPVCVEQLNWATPAASAAAWQAPAGADARVRQIDAELCQLLPAGALTRNFGGGRWRWFLPLAEPLPATQGERRSLIASLADRCVETASGLLVELAT